MGAGPIPNTEPTWWDSLRASFLYAIGSQPENASEQNYYEAIASKQEGTAIGPAKPVVRNLRPAYEYGTPVSGKRVQLEPDAQTEVGDIYEVTYKCLPVFERWQREKLKQKLLADERINLLYLSHYPEQNRFVAVFSLEKQNPFPVIAAAGIAVALALGIGIWLSTSGIAKITGFELDVNGDGKPEFKGGGLVLLALAGLGLYLYVKSR